MIYRPPTDKTPLGGNPRGRSKLASVELVRAAAAETHGQAIDILINNAGVGGGWDQTVGNMDYPAWAEVIDVNTIGPLRVLEAFLDHVAKSERKLVVTLTSGMGSIGENSSGGSPRVTCSN